MTDRPSLPRPAELNNFRDIAWSLASRGIAFEGSKLYRSGQHVGLSTAQRERLLAHQFTVVLDLRYLDEQQRDPSPWPADWASRLVSSGAHGTADAPHVAIAAAAPQGVDAVHRAYREFYAALPFDRTYRALFTAALLRLSETEGPILVHCSAGKDRTGIFIALFLALLGIPRDAIFDDFRQSSAARSLLDSRNLLCARLASEGVADAQAVAGALVGVKNDYLEATFEAVERQCGDIEGYFFPEGPEKGVLAKLHRRFVS